MRIVSPVNEKMQIVTHLRMKVAVSVLGQL